MSRNSIGPISMRYTALISLFIIFAIPAHADVLCKNKKTGAILSKKSCAKTESLVSTFEISSRSTAKVAGNSTATSIELADTGVISTGSDTSTGLDVNVNRTGATGGTLNNLGINVAVVGDGGGDSTNVGLSVNTSGADTNYSGVFLGGNVGIGVADPDEQLEIAGRLHLGQTSAPTTTTDKLYNVGGALFWGGQPVGVGTTGSGTITSVTAGNGLIGGGSSGAVAITADTGTSAGKLVQLNGSGELPAVSGANLIGLNATSISSGLISSSRLPSSVSQLGDSVSLSSEVSGILPIANGGTGAASLSNLIALGSSTTGNYVGSVATSTGLTGGSAGSEGATLSLAVDQTFTPIWTGLHSFQTGINVGTTSASTDLLHLNGRVHIEQTSAPSTTTDRLYNVGGDLFFNGQNLTDTAAGGDITSVVAGAGLSSGSGGTTGDVTIAVDVGTAANKIVQLNSSAQIPAVSGALLTNLNAANLTGEVPDGSLSANVTKLGSQIGLTSEVTGILPIANGGTGASALTDLITLGTHTSGVYVSTLTPSTGITIGQTGTEAITGTFSIDQSFTPAWTGTHTFSGVTNDIVTGTNEDFCVMPNGSGKMGIGTTSPSAKLDTVLTSTSATAGTETGVEFNFTDTGIVTTSTDTSTGMDVNVTRTGASGGTIVTTGMDLAVTGDTGGTSSAVGLNVLVSGADTNYSALFQGGAVGIGTGSPVAQLQTVLSSTSTTADAIIGGSFDVSDTGVVTTGTDTTSGLEINVNRTSSTGGTVSATGLDISVVGDNGGAGSTSTTGLVVSVSGADTNSAARFIGGSVGIGDNGLVTASAIPSGSLVIGNGALCIDNGGDDCDNGSRTAGTIYANNQTVQNFDLAEEFPIETDDVVNAGDLVMIDSHVGRKCLDTGGYDDDGECTNLQEAMIPFVTRSGSIGDNGVTRRVIGVVSTAPGVTLGGFRPQDLKLYRKVPVALAGRVPVKVSLEGGAIQIGDRITASSARGVGMRAATDSGVGIVGIALEPYDGSIPNAQILMLVR